MRDDVDFEPIEDEDQPRYWKSAKLLVELRETAGLTKARLAREAGVSDAYISQLENGTRSPSERMVRKLATTLGVHPYPLMAAADLITRQDVELIHEQTAQAEKKAEAEGRKPTTEELRRARDSALSLIEFLNRDPDEGQDPFDPSFFVFEDDLRVSGVPSPENWERLKERQRAAVQQIINSYIDTPTE